MISTNILKGHFEKHDYFIQTENKIELTLDDSEEVFLTLPLYHGRDRNIFIELMADFESLDSLIQLTNIETLDDLNEIKNSICWK